MCGFAGSLNFSGKPVEKGTLEAMARLLVHRGPDDGAIHASGAFGFCHRRLSIVGDFEAGRQPMFTPDGRIGLVYNGECYNHRELAERLERRGWKFRTDTDTEVVLAGIADEGAEFVKRMNGMFAFAAWDEREKRLLLCRDRLGIKPLYVYRDAGQIVFASEIKPILESGVESGLDRSAFLSYIDLRYSAGSRTLFGGITKLEAGTTLEVTAAGKTVSRRYWDLRDFQPRRGLGARETEREFHDLLERVVDEHRIGRYPVGTFLSGGIDSSVVTALLRRGDPEVRTYTFADGGAEGDLEAALGVARFLGVRNDRQSLEETHFELYRRCLLHLEEPLGDSILVPTFLLAAQAARDTRVVMLGEGADEALGGYAHQRALNAIFRLRHLPWQNLPSGFLRPFFPYAGRAPSEAVERVRRSRASLPSLNLAYRRLVELFPDKRAALDPEFLASVEGLEPFGEMDRYWESFENPDPFTKLCQLDLKFWNADYSLLRVDKLTMANSIEARVPYLDHRLVEFCLGVPAARKVGLFDEKRLLRGAVRGRGLIPESIRRRPKSAFFLPTEKAFPRSYREGVRETLESARFRARGLFRQDYVRALLDNERRDLLESKRLFLIYAFELWARQFLDGEWRERSPELRAPEPSRRDPVLSPAL